MQTRKGTRQSISLPGRYSIGTGGAVDAILSDLSPGGCRIEGGDPKVRKGAVVKLHIAGSGPFRAQVTWIDDGNIGVTFATKLSDDQYDRLAVGRTPEDQVREASPAGGWPRTNLPHRFV